MIFFVEIGVGSFVFESAIAYVPCKFYRRFKVISTSYDAPDINVNLMV